MTGLRDIERVLDSWFEGDDRIPGRVIDRALENIERIPQRRARRVPRRYSDMPTSLRLLGLAAALAVVGGAAFLVAGVIRPPDRTGSTDLLASTAATWSASRPAVFGHEAGTYGFDTYSDLVAFAPDGSVIPLGPVISWDGVTAVIGLIPQCLEQSTYRFTLAADYLTGTATAVSESCTDRRALIEGSWQRVEADRGLEVNHRYTLDMGLHVSFTVPDWPGVAASGPYGVTVGEPGRPPRELRVGTHRSDRPARDYELKLVVDPRPAADICDPGKGVLDDGWTLADFADEARAGGMATFTTPVATTVAGYEAIYVDVTSLSFCGLQLRGGGESVPDDSLTGRTSGRSWAIDVAGRRVLLQFLRSDDAQPNLTTEQLAIGTKLVASLELKPQAP